MAKRNEQSSFTIGPWRYDADSGLIVDGDDERRLDPVEASVLRHLAESAPDLVTMEDLLAVSWPRVVVGDNVVHRVIARLRRALGDDARRPTYIETLARRGYRMIAPVHNLGEASLGSLAGEHTNISTDNRAIAVLPFASLSADPDGEHFGDGIAEDILNSLVRSLTIPVIARTSSFQFKSRNEDARAIGEQLGVTHLLEGSVRKVGGWIRVTAQLIATSDGSHLWSEQFDRRLEDVFALQDEIAGAVLRALMLYFSARPTPPTTSTAAYVAMAESRRHTAQRRPDAASAALERALTFDPDYADAHAALAGAAAGNVWLRQSTVVEMRNAMGNHLELALARDPEHQAARAVQASLRFFLDRDFQAGIDDYHAVLAERPNDPIVLFLYAALMRAVNHIEQMVDISRIALDLDPLNPFLQSRLAEDLIWAGRYAEAEAAAERCIKMGAPAAHLVATAALLDGDGERARAQLDRGRAAWDSEDRALLFAAELALDEGDRRALERHVEALAPFASGRRARLQGPAVFRTLRASLALVEGDVETALDSFEQSINDSFMAIWYAPGFAELEPNGWWALDRRRFPAFHEHPRFHKIIDGYGLGAASLAQLRVPRLPY